MHMANELLSVPVAAGSCLIAAGGLGFVCRKAREVISSERLALMGILGAFIFAAQMVNFQLPVMAGTSGHIVGAVLLAIILGPHAGVIVMSSVVIIQCLIFQDGGLLALGCNIINMALVPSYLGFFIYKIISRGPFSSVRTYIAVMLACLVSAEVSAGLVPIEAVLSGVLLVPFSTFLTTMLGVHLLIGIFEGLITVAVIGYLHQVKPDIFSSPLPGRPRLSFKAVLVTLGVVSIVTASVFSLLASGKPDGLEWSYYERPDQPAFETIVSNEDSRVAAVDKLEDRFSVLPDYSVRGKQDGRGWKSFAGVVGSLVTMAVVWLLAYVIKKKRPSVS